MQQAHDLGMASGALDESGRLTQASLATLVFDETKGPFEAEPNVVNKDTAQKWYYEVIIISPYSSGRPHAKIGIAIAGQHSIHAISCLCLGICTW